MISQPERRISEKALKVWRLSGALGTLFIAVPAIIIIVLSFIFDWPLWVPAAAIIFPLAYTWFSVFFLPSLWWKRWRYEVREQEIEIQKGLFVIKRTLVPMVRVQHVDTSQGPILRKYKLATVMISTAATIHEIPALEEEEAEALRMQISRLARVADEDV
ncbi:PH domain-containing protein [Bacillus sp. B-jedd]|uniref:PH domain-containing protein n=1 Tax=Bacillus sp. B-jedd TaxID=1476857 RepID=UPI00051563C4|nr:PH domain-containing protein [Bacillus sp. B-jedd]CEG25356.1 YdbS [Bacillus sp. B-jedd]